MVFTPYGLGSVLRNMIRKRKPSTPSRSSGEVSWELAHHDLPLLRVDNGIARLPQERISEDKFIDAMERIYGARARPRRCGT
jgi:hypothetical protein